MAGVKVVVSRRAVAELLAGVVITTFALSLPEDCDNCIHALVWVAVHESLVVIVTVCVPPSAEKFLVVVVGFIEKFLPSCVTVALYVKEPEVKVIVEIDKQEFIARVSDNGPGIPQADLDMIFEKFFRSGSSRSQKIEGVGLGLSIVKEIVNAHNGKIYAESKEGQGCTFVIKLPLQI